MKRWLPLVAVLGMLVALRTQPVYACSAGLDYNPVAASDLIVAGHITDWQALPKTNPDSALTPIRVSMNVERVLKGSAATQFQFVDGASLDAYSNPPTWAGSSGGCGVFDADPKGKYFVLGLSKGADGAYISSRLSVFGEGIQPTFLGERYAQELAALGMNAPANLPNTGVASSFPSVPVGTSLLVLAIGAAFRLRRPT